MPNGNKKNSPNIGAAVEKSLPRKWPRRYPKTCAHCSVDFMAHHTKNRYCTKSCSRKATMDRRQLARARYGETGQKYDIPLALLQEADASLTLIDRGPRGITLMRARIKYVTDKLGCDAATVKRRAKALGFEWQPRRIWTGSMGSREQAYVKQFGCVVCGERRRVEAAHGVARQHGGLGTIENLIPLCPTHHRCYDKNELHEWELERLSAWLGWHWKKLSGGCFPPNIVPEGWTDPL